MYLLKWKKLQVGSYLIIVVYWFILYIYIYLAKLLDKMSKQYNKNVQFAHFVFKWTPLLHGEIIW